VTGLVLAAGLGKRLAPLTEERPKGLIELGGRSLLARLLDGLLAAGVHETVLVVG
jgi:choline kinase